VFGHRPVGICPEASHLLQKVVADTVRKLMFGQLAIVFGEKIKSLEMLGVVEIGVRITVFRSDIPGLFFLPGCFTKQVE